LILILENLKSTNNIEKTQDNKEKGWTDEDKDVRIKARSVMHFC
jgi:hypothetical protein